jgi:Protein of unknown function (DUF2442)
MSTLPNELLPPRADRARVTRDSLVVDLQDGRTITVPLSWYPRLHHGTARERSNWRLIAGGEGIHWPDLDEDISVEGLLAGSPSGESQESFQAWLLARRSGRSNSVLQPTAPRKARVRSARPRSRRRG